MPVNLILRPLLCNVDFRLSQRKGEVHSFTIPITLVQLFPRKGEVLETERRNNIRKNRLCMHGIPWQYNLSHQSKRNKRT
jgi:hypothetical protein